MNKKRSQIKFKNSVAIIFFTEKIVEVKYIFKNDSLKFMCISKIRVEEPLKKSNLPSVEKIIISLKYINNKEAQIIKIRSTWWFENIYD